MNEGSAQYFLLIEEMPGLADQEKAVQTASLGKYRTLFNMPAYLNKAARLRKQCHLLIVHYRKANSRFPFLRCRNFRPKQIVSRIMNIVFMCASLRTVEYRPSAPIMILLSTIISPRPFAQLLFQYTVLFHSA